MATALCFFAYTHPVLRGGAHHWHAHSCTEIVYYQSGRGLLLDKKGQARYSAGCFAISRPETRHRDQPDVDGEQLCVGLSGCGASRLPEGVWPEAEAVTDCCERIRRELSESQAPDAEERMDWLAGWLALEAARALRAENADAVETGKYPAAEKIRREIDRHFQDPISLDDLAGKLFLSKTYMRQLFREAYGQPPIHYLIARRIELACRLLRETTRPVGDIATHSGFDNVYYFSRLFRKRLGVTPSEYRKGREPSS